MFLLRAFPFLALVVIAYNVLLVFGAASPGAVAGQVRLPSGAFWSVTTGDVLVIVGLAFLFVEIVSASGRTVSRVNHALSFLVFLVCVGEFLLVPACGTPEFLYITLMTLIDVVAGYAVSLRTARPVLSAERDVIGGIQ
jgi:hypothetical protein